MEIKWKFMLKRRLKVSLIHLFHNYITIVVESSRKDTLH